MNYAFRSSATALLRYFPVALIAAMLVLFAYSAFHYSRWIADDFEFRNVLREKSISEASLYFYHNFNGRLASHFFLCSVFSIMNPFIYRFMMLAGFILSLAHLLRNYFEAFRKKNISYPQSLFLAAFVTAILFFITLEGRAELWFWISATGVYLISLVIAMNGFALLLAKKQNAFRISLAAFLFFLAGGFSESFAIMYLLLLGGMAFKAIQKEPEFLKRKVGILFSILGIGGGLLINLFSGGTHNRLAQLQDFGFLHALKNMAHSLVLGFLSFYSLMGGLIFIGIFLLYATFCFPSASKGWKYFFRKALPVLLFISISFFIPCYILSDIVPYRAASLGYFAGALFLFDYFIFRSETFGNKKGLLI